MAGQDHVDVVDVVDNQPYDDKDSKSVSNEELTDEKAVAYVPEALHHLDNIKKQHAWDPNLPQDIFDEVDNALHGSDAKAQVLIADELLDNSPYPEVRAAVSNVDEGGTGNTFRAWFLGMLFATLGSALNMLFSMRQPYIVIPSYVAQVVAFPFGAAWARYLPTRKYSIMGREFTLNPGPFTKKEHTLTVIMANATFGGGAAYATDVLLAQRVFYGQNFGWGFELLLCISSQMLGFGIAGIFNRWLVMPAAMIWPANLVNTSLFTALHDLSLPDPAKVSGWKIGKYRFFLYTFLCSFTWYWFPGYVAPFLSVFAWVTWIRPNSPVVNQLFGGWTGLSFIPMTFDWTQISGFNFSPLIAPWHAIGNTLIGMVAWFWIVTPAVHYSKLYYNQYLPISDSASYDNTQSSYNVSQILTPEFTLDPVKYSGYSPLFLSTTFMLSYGLSFATIIAVLVHVALFHGKSILQRFSTLGDEEEDVHARLIKNYKPVPLWWSLIVVLVMTALSLTTALAWDTHLSWWAFFVSIIICCVFFIPCGIIQGSTNIQIGLNVITEFIIGYMQPGRPVAMMLFKTYGYISMYQGLFFAQDQKLGMYMKVSLSR
jgi:OPT family small oligopeptide transporter